MSQKLADTATEAIKAAPPVAVLASTIAGMNLQNWVYVVTLIYLAVQLAWLLWKWWKAATTKGWRPNE